MTEPCDLSAVEARRMISAKQLSPVELVESCIKRIEATNGAVNAIVAMDEEAALEAARSAERAWYTANRSGFCTGCRSGSRTCRRRPGSGPRGAR